MSGTVLLPAVAQALGTTRLYVDRAVLDVPRVVIGGGNRSSKIVLDPAELRKLPGVEVVDGLATVPISLMRANRRKIRGG